MFFCSNEDLLRGIKKYTPAHLTTMCRNTRKPLLQTSPSVQSTFSVFALGTNRLPRQHTSIGFSSISCALNLKINIYFHFPTNVSFHVYIRIHRYYITSVCKANKQESVSAFISSPQYVLALRRRSQNILRH